MDLIDKYIGEDNSNTLDEDTLDEVLGRGQGHVLSNVKGNNIKKLEKLLKSNKINYTKDTKGTLVVGDDDFDEVEEIMVRKLGIF